MSDRNRNRPTFWALFEATGQKFPIRYMETTDQYEVELPAGVYGGEYIEDLKRVLKEEFNNVRIMR
jgi:hypothetical protein